MVDRMPTFWAGSVLCGSVRFFVAPLGWRDGRRGGRRGGEERAVEGRAVEGRAVEGRGGEGRGGQGKGRAGAREIEEG